MRHAVSFILLISFWTLISFVTALEDQWNVCEQSENSKESFFYTFESASNGCSINCIFLKSTLYEGFFDTMYATLHLLEGSACGGDDHVSNYQAI